MPTLRRTPAATLTLLALLGAAAACGDGAPPGQEAMAAGAVVGDGMAAGGGFADAEPGASASTVEVTATHSGDQHLFQVSRAEVPRGWTTFRFTNASPFDHFAVLYRAPDEAIAGAEAAGRPLLEHWFQTVTAPFQEAYDPYHAGDLDFEGFTARLVEGVSEGAPWFFDPGAPPASGPGLTAAGATSETTVLLEPGTYVLECYVKDAEGIFHSYIGMLEQVVVTGDEGTADAPAPTAELTVAQPAEGGIRAPADLRPGLHTFAIHFGDQPEAGYEHFLGHNVQLARLDDADDPALLDRLAEWMTWTHPGGLTDRAPDGVEFMGGVMEMPGGGTAYFTARLEPGAYAWIAEVPDPAGKGMLRTFTVPGPAAGAGP